MRGLQDRRQLFATFQKNIEGFGFSYITGHGESNHFVWAFKGKVSWNVKGPGQYGGAVIL